MASNFTVLQHPSETHDNFTLENKQNASKDQNVTETPSHLFPSVVSVFSTRKPHENYYGYSEINNNISVVNEAASNVSSENHYEYAPLAESHSDMSANVSITGLTSEFQNPISDNVEMKNQITSTGLLSSNVSRKQVEFNVNSSQSHPAKEKDLNDLNPFTPRPMEPTHDADPEMNSTNTGQTQSEHESRMLSNTLLRSTDVSRLNQVIGLRNQTGKLNSIWTV
ncbi:unnamed protein product [Orchesella dallaii]|uniref:Uncharacterized protein n=1 Tax=Orchesella dallaii TaxID=48710 RepID=A0ABP1RUP3_9HEXA